MTKALRAAVAVLLAGLLLAACSDDEPALDAGDDTTTTAAAAGGETVTVTATDYAFAGAETIPGGVVTIELKNDGKEPHALLLQKLEEGKTFQDFAKGLQSEEEGPPPSWLVSSGGTAANPGTTSTFTLDLAAGAYAIMCPVPAQDGQPHFAKGMLGPVTVNEGESGDLPEADLTVGAVDFKFEGVEALKAGEHTVRFDNRGKEDHEMIVVDMAPGKTSKDLAAFFASQGPPQGPPPFTGFSAGIGPIRPGKSANFTASFKAGSGYAIVCIVGNDKGPHMAQGMAYDLKA